MYRTLDWCRTYYIAIRNTTFIQQKIRKKQGYQDRQNARQSTGDEIDLNQV